MTTARSATEAFRLLKQVHPDVLVSDIGMPFEDGYEIRKVRALSEENGGKVPAVALTAYARPDDRMRALRAQLPNACVKTDRANGTCDHCGQLGQSHEKGDRLHNAKRGARSQALTVRLTSFVTCGRSYDLCARAL